MKEKQIEEKIYKKQLSMRFKDKNLEKLHEIKKQECLMKLKA